MIVNVKKQFIFFSVQKICQIIFVPVIVKKVPLSRTHAYKPAVAVEFVVIIGSDSYSYIFIFLELQDLAVAYMEIFQIIRQQNFGLILFLVKNINCFYIFIFFWYYPFCF